MRGLARLFGRFLPGTLLRYAQGLRWPNLFLLMLVLFVADLVLPDFIPFLDEILLALATMLLAAFKKRKVLS